MFNKCSIIFSFWTSTLDILEDLLSSEGVELVRIDGGVSDDERLRRLNRFREKRTVQVLLMTIGTGAVG